MFNNLNPHVDLPHSEENNKGVEVKNVEKTNYNRLEVPIVLKPENATFDDIALHGLLRQRLSIGTVNRNLRYLRFMELHPCPVNFRNPTYENYIRHMDYREQIEGSKWGALKHQKQAMRMYLLSIGKNPTEWYYKPPPRTQIIIRKIPYPDQVHQILHQKYSTDKTIDSNIKHLLSKNFIYGWRVPNEPITIKVSDIDLENATLTMKCSKQNLIRTIDIAELANRRNTYSFKNLIDIIRPRIENQHSKDYLFLKPDGKPYDNPEQLRMYLNRKVNPTIKKVFPEYTNYITRKWCTIARLIRTKVLSKKYDEYEVMDFIHHTKIETTIGYLRDSKFYYQKAPYDWIKRVLKNHHTLVEHNSIGSEYTENALVQNQNPSVALSRRLPTAKYLTGVKRFCKTLKNVYSGFASNLSFFFSFFKHNGDGHKKTQHEGSQLNGVKAFSAFFLCSSLRTPHHLSEIPIPLLLRAGNFSYFLNLPSSFLRSYPSPLSSNEISDFYNYFIKGERKIWNN